MPVDGQNPQRQFPGAPRVVALSSVVERQQRRSPRLTAPSHRLQAVSSVERLVDRPASVTLAVTLFLDNNTARVPRGRTELFDFRD